MQTSPAAPRLRLAAPWLAPLLVGLLVLADQALKGWARSNLEFQGTPIPFIPYVIDWYLTYNTGAAWSLFSGSALPLAIGRLLVGLAILVYLVRRPQPRLFSVLLSMIAAGAIGNAIDGFLYGRVWDMIHAPPLSAVTRALGQGDFPIFNLADICVVCGTILLLVSSVLHERAAGKQAAHSAEQPQPPEDR